MPNLAIAASVSPPPAIENAGEAAIASRERLGAAGERIELEHADRAVPDDGAGACAMIARSAAAVCGPMSRIMSSAVDVRDRLQRRRRASAANSLAHDDVDRAAAPCPESAARIAFASPTRSGSASDLPIVQAGREHEGVGDAAADDQRVDLRGERLQDRELGRDLGAGDDRHQRPLRVARAPAPSASSSAASSGPAQATGANLRDAVRRRLGAVRGAEGVVHVDVAERGHLARQRLVVLLLALVEAAVLEQHDLARLERREPGAAVDPVADQRHLAARAARDSALRDRRERILRG